MTPINEKHAFFQLECESITGYRNCNLSKFPDSIRAGLTEIHVYALPAFPVSRRKTR